MGILKINGRQRQFPDGVPKTVTQLLEHLNIKAATIVAEIDGQILDRNLFAETELQDGQEIELVRFVGGG